MIDNIKGMPLSFKMAVVDKIEINDIQNNFDIKNNFVYIQEYRAYQKIELSYKPISKTINYTLQKKDV
ncbi:MAG: hypothetical protein EAZ44_05425 [Cytophagia bacterium]|nr:MAG: hypothetical protein EAY69_06875 [Cytophagales bacterium]TAG03977.1 MAG: hypothetical protein EAZ44_05425 [Cytophagia bacterium]TAG42663.1 MAG: hypothetical protein EAZ31_05655 [Cytophagia bacterium]